MQGNQLLDQLFGATSQSFSRATFSAEHDAIVEAAEHMLRGEGCTPRYTPAGASEPLGCWGYIRCAAELAPQLHREGVEAADIVVALSSGGTYAGLVLGKLLHRLDHYTMWGIPVSDDVDYHVHHVGELCRTTIERFGLPIEYDDSMLQLIEGYVGEGYAVQHRSANEALRRMARTEGIVLDPVYSAKAMWGLLEQLQERALGHERPVVFVHTGGLFSNFAWPEILDA